MKPALAHSLSHIYSIKWSLGFQKPQQMSQASLMRLRAIYKKCALRPFWQINHKLSRENVSHGLYWENHHICRAQLRHLASRRGWFYSSPHTSSHHNYANLTFHARIRHLTSCHPGFCDKVIQNRSNANGQIWCSVEGSTQKRCLWSASVYFSKINACLFLDYGQGAYRVC